MSSRPWAWSNNALSKWAMSFRPDDPHEAIFEVCGSSGLAGIEGWTHLCETDGEAEALGRRYEQAGVQIHTFHLPFAADPNVDIASFYETHRRAAVDTAKRWMHRSAALGSQVLIQHPSVNPASVEVEGVDAFVKPMVKSLNELLPEAESLGQTIAIENMLPGHPPVVRFGSQPEHFRRIREAIDHPALGFCYDTGHALVSGREKAVEILEVMKPRFAALHAADNPGDRDAHLAPGHGLVDWSHVFQTIHEIGYSGVACIETPPFAPGPDYGPEAFAQMVREADQLVQDALGTTV